MPNHWFICQRCNLQSPEANYDRLPDGWVHLGISDEIISPKPDYRRGCFLCPKCAQPIVDMCREGCPETPRPDITIVGQEGQDDADWWKNGNH